jgi:hypothetical protein
VPLWYKFIAPGRRVSGILIALTYHEGHEEHEESRSNRMVGTSRRDVRAWLHEMAEEIQIQQNRFLLFFSVLCIASSQTVNRPVVYSTAEAGHEPTVRHRAPD